MLIGQTHFARVLGHQLGLLLCSSNSFPRVWASAKSAAMALGDWQILPVGSGTKEQRVFEGKLCLLIFDRTGSDGQTEDATLAAGPATGAFHHSTPSWAGESKRALVSDHTIS